MSGSETDITVQPAALAKLVVSGFPTNPIAGMAYIFAVTASDSFGNLIIGYSGTVNLSSTDSNASFSPASYTFTSTDNGTHTFSTTLKTAGPQSISAADATNNLSGTETGITVQPASLAKLIVSGFPPSPTAGTAYNFTVSATDTYGNMITGYLGTVILSSTDSNASFSPANYTFVAADKGTHTFSATLETAGLQSIKATDATNNASGTETDITVQPASLARLIVSGFPRSLTAGTASNFTVTTMDAFGNVITGYLGTVNLSSTDPNASFSPASYTFVAADKGMHTFSATLETAGLQSIKATDATSNVSGTETGITVQPASLAKLMVSGFPTGPTAGTAYNFTVRATDSFGNVITGYLGTVNLSSTDSNASFSPMSYNFTASDSGTHTFSATLETAGNQSLTVADATNSLSGTETGITVQPAAARTLTVTGFPTNPVAGTAYNVEVTVLDAYNNVATGYTGTVAFSSSDGHAVFPLNYKFTAADAGTHTFSVTLETAGTQSITVTDAVTPSVNGSEGGIEVQVAAAKTLKVTAFPATETAGVANQVTVTAYDAYGNLATAYVGTVAFSSTDGHAVLPADFTFTGSDAGTHTFSVTLETAGTQSITATDEANATITGSESNITIKAAAAKTLTVSAFPATDTAGVAENVVVTALDAFGNVATGYVGTVAFSSSDSRAIVPGDFTFNGADAGTRTFSVTLETAGSQSITVTDSNTPSIIGSESNIVVQAAAAKTLTISGFPATTTAGTANDVVVTAYDLYGNVATGYVGTVALTSTDAQAVLPANFTFTALDAGSHSFPITLETAGTQSIAVRDTAAPTLSASDTAISVQAAAARTLTVAGFPVTETAGVADQITVAAYDAFGNPAVGYLGTVAFSSSDGQAVLPAAYTFTDSDSGTHTFSLTLKTAGTQSIAATDSTTASITGSESNIIIKAATAKTLSVTAYPTTSTAGVPENVVVTAHRRLRERRNRLRGKGAVFQQRRPGVLPGEL